MNTLNTKANFENNQSILLQQIEEKSRDLIEHARNGGSDFFEVFGFSIKEQYNDLLDELESTEKYDGSDLLEKMDPIAYRTGLNDYTDSVCSDLSYELLNLQNQKACKYNGLMYEIVDLYIEVENSENNNDLLQLQKELKAL